jgi:hypothetical protein
MPAICPPLRPLCVADAGETAVDVDEGGIEVLDEGDKEAEEKDDDVVDDVKDVADDEENEEDAEDGDDADAADDDGGKMLVGAELDSGEAGEAAGVGPVGRAVGPASVAAVCWPGA